MRLTRISVGPPEAADDERLIAPEVGFSASFSVICLQLSRLHEGNQAYSTTTRADFLAASCWQFC